MLAYNMKTAINEGKSAYIAGGNLIIDGNKVASLDSLDIVNPQ